MRELITNDNCIYTFNKSCVDYKTFDKFSSKSMYFITRSKANVTMNEVTHREITCSQSTLLDNSVNVIEDITCYLDTKYINLTEKQYRVILVIDS